MLKQKAKIVSLTLFFTDLFVTALSFVVSYYLRFVLPSSLFMAMYPFRKYLWLLGVTIFIWGILLPVCGLFRSFRTRPMKEEIFRIIRVSLIGDIILIAVIFIVKAYYISRPFVIIFGGINILFLSAERAFIRMIGRTVRRRGYNYRTILVAGKAHETMKFTKLIEEHREWGLNLFGIVCNDKERSTIEGHGYQVLGTIEDIPKIILNNVIDEVAFVGLGKDLRKYEELFLICEEQGVRTKVTMDFLPRNIAKVYIEKLNNLPLMTFTTIPNDEFLLLIKRTIDVVLSLLILIFVSPLMLVVAIGIALTSEGPILFRQVRSGINGRSFVLFKFRSMYKGAEAMKPTIAHLNEMNGPVFKVRRDPRVTPIGWWIRKYSIDELPQLWNVLKGDMSIVGPRPPIPEEIEKYERWQRRRLSMKPGLTCIWQVSGRSNIDFGQWMKMDLEYIDKWSLWIDLQIILKTIPAVLSGKGAH